MADGTDVSNFTFKTPLDSSKEIKKKKKKMLNPGNKEHTTEENGNVLEGGRRAD